MNVLLLRMTEAPAELCGLAAATCTKSSDYEKSFNHAMSAGHTSILEHAVFTFKIEGISRAALAQLTRHRIASFDVESQRYVKLEDMNYILPDSIKNSKLRKQASELIENAMSLYNSLIEVGIPAEDARFVTPQAMTTNLVMTMNARELLHFFSLRTCNRAQWEIRDLADRMLKICCCVAPAIFESAGPGCVTGKCTEARPCGHPRIKEDWKI